jgi:hypothetical protein
MEKRKILTSHGALAALASERIIIGRFMTLADAVRDHEGRTPPCASAAGPTTRRCTEELQLPRLPDDATLHVPPGEAGLREDEQRPGSNGSA